MTTLTITLIAIGWTLAATFAFLYFATDDKLADCEAALRRLKVETLLAEDDLAHSRRTTETLLAKAERDRERDATVIARVLQHNEKQRNLAGWYR